MVKLFPKTNCNMIQKRQRSVLNTVVAGALLLAAGLAVAYAMTPNVPRPQEIEGRPLLEMDGPQFIDTQVGISFTPPTGWAMQSRSTESPTTHKAERTIVKFKRLVPGPKAAWFKVTVADVAGDPTPAELIRTRKPRETHFVVTKEPEDDLTIAGRPASRITFGGEMDTDAKRSRHCTTEIIAMRHGPTAIYFMGTYATADPEGLKMIRDAVESAVFTSK